MGSRSRQAMKLLGLAKRKGFNPKRSDFNSSIPIGYDGKFEKTKKEKAND